jgi:hypothetical protein
MTRRILKTYGGVKRNQQETGSSSSSAPNKKQKNDDNSPTCDKAQEDPVFKISRNINLENLAELDEKISKNIDFLKDSLKSINSKTQDDSDPNSMESVRSNLIKELFLSVKKPGRSSKTYLNIEEFREQVSSGKNFKHFEFLLSILKLISEQDFVIDDNMKFILSTLLIRIEEDYITNIYAKGFMRKLTCNSNSYTYIPNDLYFELQNQYLNAILNKYSGKITKKNDMKLFIDNYDENIIKRLITRNYSAFTANTIVENLIKKL